MVPASLHDALRPVTIVVGHYGVGKTNFSVNLALDMRKEGAEVTVVDLDIVNPYFRATEQRELLEGAGIKVVAPVFAERGQSLDAPSLTGAVTAAIEDAHEGAYVICDVGGDDVGAVSLGRYAQKVSAGDYAMLYVVNSYRNLISDAKDAADLLREVETASHLKATAIVSNSHLKSETKVTTITDAVSYARDVASLTQLPLACITVPAWLADDAASRVEFDACQHLLYPIEMYIKNPWE